LTVPCKLIAWALPSSVLGFRYIDSMDQGIEATFTTRGEKVPSGPLKRIMLWESFVKDETNATVIERIVRDCGFRRDRIASEVDKIYKQLSAHLHSRPYEVSLPEEVGHQRWKSEEAFSS